MESNLLTNKIISIIIALVVTLCVLVPITSSYGGNGNGGEGDSSGLQKLAYYGSYYDELTTPYLYSDTNNTYCDEVIVSEDGNKTNIRFVPNQDGRTYAEGEIVAVLFPDLSYLLLISYTNNSFVVNSISNGGISDELVINGFVIGTEYNDLHFIQYLDSADDITFKTSDTEDFEFDWGYVKTNASIAPTVYITNDENVTIEVTDAEQYAQQPDMDTITYIIKLTMSYGNNTMELYTRVPSIFDGEGNEYLAMDIVSEEVPDFEERCKMPISLDKWKFSSTESSDEMSATFDINPQYLIFDSRIPYEPSSSTGTDDEDNGAVGTLIQIIPLFVILGILMSIVGTFYTRSKSQMN